MDRINSLTDCERVVEEIGFLPYYGDAKQLLFTLGGWTDNAWHDDSPNDPWQWRVRVAEKGEQAYGKFFRRKSGFVARRCIPAFIAVRTENRTLEELYEDGRISREARALWECFCTRAQWTYQELKRAAGYGIAASKDFEKALVDLQMLFFITVCGQSRRINREGLPYGWPNNDFIRMDVQFPKECALNMEKAEAEELLLACARRAGDFSQKDVLRLIR